MFTLQDQYKNTNIERLLMGLDTVIKKYSVDIITSFLEDTYNLETADSHGLDIWGLFLNFPRTIRFSMQYESEEKSKTLNDDEYRVILQLIALQSKAKMSIPEINKQLKIIFNKYDSDCFVYDNQNMSYANIVMMWEIPDFLRAVFQNYNVFPHPHGVGIRFVEGLFQVFGFEGKGGCIGNFYNTIFFNEEHEEIEKRLKGIFGFTGSSIGGFVYSNFFSKRHIHEDITKESPLDKLLGMTRGVIRGVISGASRDFRRKSRLRKQQGVSPKLRGFLNPRTDLKIKISGASKGTLSNSNFISKEFSARHDNPSAYLIGASVKLGDEKKI